MSYSYTFNVPDLPDPPRPARFWSKADDDPQTVVCEVCPHHCRVKPGRSGRCRVRTNSIGAMALPFYGKYTSLAIDPIEKKPLYHFFPGSQILSIGTAGCNLSCKFCQNWQISQGDFSSGALSFMGPARLADLAIGRQVPAVAFTYNEPSIWAEYVIDAARECRRRGLRTVAVTNGMIEGRAREEFYGVLDGVNIDLKAFTDEFYRGLCGGELRAVRETLRYAVRETDVWVEATNLLIPTKNDDPDDLKRLVDWFVGTLGPDVPLHFSAFFPTFRLTDVPKTPPETVYRALEIAKDAGVRYVYAGNVWWRRGHSTACPECGEEVVTRTGFRSESRITPEGKCPKCGAAIPGRYSR
ncbi:MAG: AmmeMemoRadiSam system radical SAM enzyme [Thermoguttaceae bacterium]|nr:AmmeMemoRadiSam system radical SAM enzyme [Thermoguttaceae bacterium]